MGDIPSELASSANPSEQDSWRSSTGKLPDSMLSALGVSVDDAAAQDLAGCSFSSKPSGMSADLQLLADTCTGPVDHTRVKRRDLQAGSSQILTLMRLSRRSLEAPTQQIPVLTRQALPRRAEMVSATSALASDPPQRQLVCLQRLYTGVCVGPVAVSIEYLFFLFFSQQGAQPAE